MSAALVHSRLISHRYTQSDANCSGKMQAEKLFCAYRLYGNSGRRYY